jgi:nicotinamide-nucleotide amidase
MKDLLSRAERLALLLKDRRETVAVAESSAGGLVSAALLTVRGLRVLPRRRRRLHLCLS